MGVVKKSWNAEQRSAKRNIRERRSPLFSNAASEAPGETGGGCGKAANGPALKHQPGNFGGQRESREVIVSKVSYFSLPTNSEREFF